MENGDKADGSKTKDFYNKVQERKKIREKYS